MTFIQSVSWGVVASTLMLAVFFGVVGLVSGWAFALEQFARYRPYIVALALGFGVQVGLYVTLRQLVGMRKMPGTLVAASGTTSTAAMVSCCAHYLANVLPVLGVTGFVAVVAQYQVELFWVGLVFNLAGIAFIAPKVVKAWKEHTQCLVDT